MSRRIETLYTPLGDIDRDRLDKILNEYSENIKKINLSEVEDIKEIVSGYIINIGDVIFSETPKRVISELNSVLSASTRLNRLLKSADAVSAIQDLSESIKKKSHSAKLENSDSTVPSAQLRNIEENLDDFYYKWSRQSAPRDDGVDVYNEIYLSLANLNKLAITSGSLTPEGISFGMLMGNHLEDEYGGIFGIPIIYTLRQALSALEKSIIDQIGTMSRAYPGATSLGAPSEEYTSIFLCEIHDVYRSISSTDEIDEGFFRLTACISKYIGEEVQKIYGKSRRSRVAHMSNDAIRVAISRFRKRDITE